MQPLNILVSNIIEPKTLMKFPSKKSFSLLQTIMSLFAVVAKKPTCSF